MIRQLSVPPEKQVEFFKNLETPRQVAELLEVRYDRLIYWVYKVLPERKYSKFEVPKRSGGVRTILSPHSSLKNIQRNLAEVLANVYMERSMASAMGFVPGRNVVLNASNHVKKKWLLNLDIEDFFPSINFGRVRGLFMGYPYNLPSKVATLLAQICCFENQLPQGAPTSPIVSNMICYRLDKDMQMMAKAYKCFYTRYADDISISSTFRVFPSDLAAIKNDSGVELGKEVERIIGENGFAVNSEKTRLQPSYTRQEVTGLIVNSKVNIKRKFSKQIRAMLHAWDKYGLTNAEKDFHEKYDRKHRNPALKRPIFTHVLKGKIEYLGMVRGHEDKVYKDLKNKYFQLKYRDKGFPSISVTSLDELRRAHVFVEGATDRKILETAWRKLYPELPLPFEIRDSNPAASSPERSGGGAQVLRDYLNALREDHPYEIGIGLFDNDKRGIEEFGKLHKHFVHNLGKDWKYSANRRAGALLLPVPEGKEKYVAHRNLCIEFYFDEEILSTKTVAGLGLVFEFPSIQKLIGDTRVESEEENTILESRVIREGKTLFAEEIVPFLGRGAFENFEPLFMKILEMIAESKI